MNATDALLRCLSLASHGRGSVGINPMVGAVLVRNGKIIAEAFHERFGAEHAEAKLIKEFDQKFQQQDMLFVNLEPCCHTPKKTPPCADAIIRSGIKHVVVGMLDPNPAVQGRGIAVLRKSHIEVVGPIERARSEWLNRGFIALQTKGRPWITLHEARTRDGRHASRDGSSLKITSAEQDRWNHQHLRAQHDAILVGAQTIITDDPELTVRHGERKFQPLRIVLDPKLRVPLAARMLNGDLAKATVMIKEASTSTALRAGETEEKIQKLKDRGVRILSVPQENGQFLWSELFRVLTTPIDGFFGLASILVEGGPKTWQACREAGMVDAEAILVGNV